MAISDEPDWNDLRCFLAIAQAGSLSGAARRLGVRHTTVARRIASLETALGAALLVRGSTGIALTPLGVRLLPASRDLESAIARFGECATGGGRRVIRLAAPSGLGALVAARIAELDAAAPDVDLVVMGGSRSVDLARDEADLALRVGAIADTSLIATRLAIAGWSLYAADAYLAKRPAPADPRALEGHALIGFAGPLANSPAAAWIAKHCAGAAVVLRLGQMTEVLDAAVAGAGLALLPCVLANSDPRLRRLTPEVLGSQPLALVWRREIGREAPVRAVIRFVTSVIRDHAASIAG